VLRPNETIVGDKAIAMSVEATTKSLEEQRSTVAKYLDDADTFIRGVEGMKQTLQEAADAGRIDPEAAQILSEVVEKFGSNLQHVAMAFIDTNEFRGAFIPAKNLILLSTEKIKHEGVAAGLEEISHGVEALLTPEMRVEVQQTYIRELNNDIQGLKEARDFALEKGFKNVAKELEDTLTWLNKALVDSANGKRADTMPPIHEFYKYSDTSEFWADRMRKYEWLRLQGLGSPSDTSLLGRASKFVRDFSRAITDGYQDLMGDDKLRTIWKKLSKEELKPNGMPLHATPWFDSIEDAKSWAEDFSLRPGDGMFDKAQRPLPAGVQKAMERTSPESLKRRGFIDQFMHEAWDRGVNDEKYGSEEGVVKDAKSTKSQFKRYWQRAIVKMLEEYQYADAYEKQRFSHKSNYSGETRGRRNGDD